MKLEFDIIYQTSNNTFESYKTSIIINEGIISSNANYYIGWDLDIDDVDINKVSETYLPDQKNNNNIIVGTIIKLYYP